MARATGLSVSTSLAIRRKPRVAPTATGPGRVLLAEDDADFRQLLRESLERNGFEVRAVDDGSLLLSALTQALIDDCPDFDVVVSDVRMPGWSGLAALNALRCAGCDIPVILVSAFPAQEVVYAARELGARLLHKPFELEELTLAVQCCLPPRPQSAPS